VSSQGDPVDDLITKVLLEEKAGMRDLVVGNYCVRWELANDHQLVFAVVFQKFLSNKGASMDDLLRRIKRHFVRTFDGMLGGYKCVTWRLACGAVNVCGVVLWSCA
jgi:hypothetical protein